MPFFSEIIRFALPSQRTADFARLRTQLASRGAVLSQYYGPTSNTRSSLPVRSVEMCWVIQWHSRPTTLAEQIDALKSASGATSLLFEFEDNQKQNVEQALEAPLCQFATINLVSEAPVHDPSLQASMRKTYTDCFLADHGFTGGDWAYAANTNNTDGLPLHDSSTNTLLPSTNRRLGVYFLGWTNHAAHDAYSATPLFDEEIDKLKPWFGPGTGAWYVTFKKHVDDD